MGRKRARHANTQQSLGSNDGQDDRDNTEPTTTNSTGMADNESDTDKSRKKPNRTKPRSRDPENEDVLESENSEVFPS